MKTLALLAILLTGCGLDDGDSGRGPGRGPCATTSDAGPGATCEQACCALDGEVLLCPPDGVTCRDCRPDPAVKTFCCGVGCP